MSVSGPEAERGGDGERSEGPPSRASRRRFATAVRRGNAARIGGFGLKPVVLLLLLLAALVAGCGGDDEQEARTTQTLPELTVPEPDIEPKDEPETTTQAEPPAPEPVEPEVPDDGGAPAPEPTQPDAPADTPENDVPPPANSPAERFEEFCEENPGACG